VTPAFASYGIDTASGVTNLPFNIEGVPVMNMTATGLAIGIGTAAPSVTLEVENSGTTRLQYDLTNDSDYSIPLTFQNQSVTCANGGQWGFGLNGSSPETFGSMPAGSFWIQEDCFGPRLVITGGGNIGFGTTSPSGRIDSETGGAGLWAGMFNYNAGNPTGAYGVYAYGTTYGVYGQTTNSQGVFGYASGSGNGVLGESASGWSGNFQGTYGVYGQSANGGWAAEFNSTNSQNGVWIGNNSNNAQLCLNGQCTQSLPSMPAHLYSCPSTTQLNCGGAWASFGCMGQLTTNSTCTNYVNNGNCDETFNCTQLY
jgi:hypothetical protein